MTGGGGGVDGHPLVNSGQSQKIPIIIMVIPGMWGWDAYLLKGDQPTEGGGSWMVTHPWSAVVSSSRSQWYGWSTYCPGGSLWMMIYMGYISLRARCVGAPTGGGGGGEVRGGVMNAGDSLQGSIWIIIIQPEERLHLENKDLSSLKFLVLSYLNFFSFPLEKIRLI